MGVIQGTEMWNNHPKNFLSLIRNGEWSYTSVQTEANKFEGGAGKREKSKKQSTSANTRKATH